jgi:hypothetical protein
MTNNLGRARHSVRAVVVKHKALIGNSGVQSNCPPYLVIVSMLNSTAIEARRHVQAVSLLIQLSGAL